MAHYFLAIGIPKSLQSFYQNWQDQVKELFPYKRWTAAEDLHLTLQFLGEGSKESIDNLIARLQRGSFPSTFPLTLGTLGGFGRTNRPRVLFVDVHPGKELYQLQETVAKICEEAGFKSEKRPYRPHVTLGKKWNSTADLPAGKLAELQRLYSEEQVFQVTAFTLYTIHPKKVPSYEPVATFPLNN